MFDFSYSLVRDETSHENKQFLIPSKYRSTPFKMCVYAKLNQILAVGLKSCILLKQNRNFVYSRSLIFRVELLGRVREFVQLQLWSNGL